MGELEYEGNRIGTCGTSSKNVSSVDSHMFINYKKAYQTRCYGDNFTLCYTS